MSSTPTVSRSARYRKVLVLHGPNLNLLGTREPQTYGHTTLADINDALAKRAAAAGIGLDTFQSNHEGALVDRVHAARGEGVDLVIINPAAFTHTSVALRDALSAVGIPFIEVHLSNPYAREMFRRHSYFADLAVGVIAGFGAESYYHALEVAISRLRKPHPPPVSH